MQPDGHLKSRKRLFWIWADMTARCRNESHKAYKNYGGRGIKVCERWESFENFLADMGVPAADLLLDRRDNNLGYSPENCRWVTRKVQNSNRRNCIYVMDGGEMITLKELCRRRGVKYRPIHKRVAKGWPVEFAINTPMRGQNGYTQYRAG